MRTVAIISMCILLIGAMVITYQEQRLYNAFSDHSRIPDSVRKDTVLIIDSSRYYRQGSPETDSLYELYRDSTLYRDSIMIEHAIKDRAMRIN